MLPKHKKLTILLLIATIAIWGIIAFKIFSYLFGNSTTKTITENMPNTRQSLEEDNYTLATIDRDPFLSIITDTADVFMPDTPVSRTVVNKKVVSSHPRPKYCGLIRNGDNTFAIIKINNQYNFLQKGQGNAFLKIVTIRDSEVVILYHDERLTIPIITNEQSNVLP